MTSHAQDHYIDDVITRLQDQVEAQADKIKLLRAALREIVEQYNIDSDPYRMVEIARRALEPKP